VLDWDRDFWGCEGRDVIVRLLTALQCALAEYPYAWGNIVAARQGGFFVVSQVVGSSLLAESTRLFPHLPYV
jgi:hypothetical protein